MDVLKQTLANFVAALDAAERRPHAVRLCHWWALALLAASFVPDLILVMDFSRPYQIAQFSQDEFWFLEEIYKLQNAILNGDWAAIRNFGSPFAYGFPFWLFTSLIALPFCGHVMLMTLFLRLVFMAMKYAAFYVIYHRIFALTRKPIVSLLSLVLMLAIPAYVFDGKIISPEYFIMLLVAVGWSVLFIPKRYAQMGAGFVFALATVIKINVAPLGLLFIPPLLAHPAKQRLQCLKWWIIGAVPALILFLFPSEPFKEILEINTLHHISYGPEYLLNWYSYNALEFDDMLVGGWGIDFIGWFSFLALIVVAVYRVTNKQSRPKNWPRVFLPLLAGTFFVALLVCFMTSFTSLMHTWFVFVPFLLLIGSGCVLLGLGREGTFVMLVFVLLYTFCFGDRYVARWEHRIDKFETVAASERDNAEVASWIAKNCPKAREAVIDYNLIWPTTYNVYLQRMWTPVEVDDYRRVNNITTSAALLDNIDLILPKRERVRALLSPAYQSTPVPGALLGAFFPNTAPYFVWQHDFPAVSLFAREGVCKAKAQ